MEFFVYAGSREEEAYAYYCRLDPICDPSLGFHQHVVRVPNDGHRSVNYSEFAAGIGNQDADPANDNAEIPRKRVAPRNLADGARP